MKQKKLLINKSLLFALVALSVICLVEYSYAYEWEKTFGGSEPDHGYSVQQTTDGGYIIAGYTYSFSGVSTDADVYLIKTDADGNEDWSNTFGGSEPDHGYSVQQTTDGGYIIAGHTYSFSGVTTDADVYLIKTDADGNESWSNTFGGGEFDYGRSVQQTTDGGYIIAGSTSPFSGATWDANVYLIKTDGDGNEDWSNTFGGSGTHNGHSVQQTTDGGYIIAGYTYSFSGVSTDPAVYLIKTDSDGNEDWSNTFGGGGNDSGYSVQQTSDGGYIIAGYTYSYSGVSTDADVYLIKTDGDGNEDWSNTFDGGEFDFGRSVQQTADGGYIIAGYTCSFVFTDADVYLIKTDSDGNEDWSNTFGGSGSDYGYSVQQTTDGGYIIAGVTGSFGAGSSDVYLIYYNPRTVGDELAVDFGGNGLWHYDGSTWTQLNGQDPEAMEEWDGGLAADFSSAGLWNYDGSSWDLLTTLDPEGMEDWAGADSQTLFKAKTDYPAGDGASSVAIGDLDEDGHLDLAVANKYSDIVSVLLGNGDGTLQSPANYGTGSTPHSLAVGDLDGDGHLDIAAANEDSNNVSVLLGNGDGTFQAAVNYGTNSIPNHVAIGDLNGDGDLDLATANESTGIVSVLLGNGDGTFQTAVIYDPGLWSLCVAIGDLNGDGNLDMAVVSDMFLPASDVSVLLGNGDGTFQTAVGYAVGGWCYYITIEDLDRDGALDLVVANDMPLSDISVLLGNGDGTFQTAVNYEAGIRSRSIAIGDLDGDGHLDLAVANTFSDNVSVLLGNGDGTFQTAVNYGAGGYPRSIAIGDLDGDGDLDLAVANKDSDNVSVFINTDIDRLGDELAVDFGGTGLWNYNGSSWDLLTTNDPQDMESWTDGLAVDFGTFGLWNFDGSSWNLLTTSDAQNLTAWTDGLTVDFGTFGLWNYNGSSWDLLTTSNAQDMEAWSNGLAVDFDTFGLWNYDGSTWNLLTTSNAEYMAAWASGLAVDFGGTGLWSYDGSSWDLLTTNYAQDMEGWATSLAVDLGASGLWNYDGSSWASLTGLDSEDMIDVDLY